MQSISFESHRGKPIEISQESDVREMDFEDVWHAKIEPKLEESGHNKRKTFFKGLWEDSRAHSELHEPSWLEILLLSNFETHNLPFGAFLNLSETVNAHRNRLELECALEAGKQRRIDKKEDEDDGLSMFHPEFPKFRYCWAPRFFRKTWHPINQEMWNLDLTRLHSRISGANRFTHWFKFHRKSYTTTVLLLIPPPYH